MDDSQVLFVGAADGLWGDLSRSLEDEGLVSVRLDCASSWSARRDLHHVDAVITGPEVEASERLELCRKIRSSSLAAITVISDEMDEIDEMRLVVAGACDISVLPIRPRVMAAQLANRIGRHKVHGPAAVLTFRNVQVRVEEHSVTVNGESLELTKTEFDLIVYLMRNPRRVYTHDELSRWLWDDPWVVDHHRLEAHVCRLRKKVVRAGGPPLIASIRGVGYRLMTAADLPDSHTVGA